MTMPEVERSVTGHEAKAESIQAVMTSWSVALSVSARSLVALRNRTQRCAAARCDSSVLAMLRASSLTRLGSGLAKRREPTVFWNDESGGASLLRRRMSVCGVQTLKDLGKGQCARPARR